MNWTSVLVEGAIWGIVNGMAGGLTKGLDFLTKGSVALTQAELTMLNVFFIPTFDTLGLLGDSLYYKYSSSLANCKMVFGRNW